MSKQDWVVALVTQIVGDGPTAEMVVERLKEEGLLNLGYGNADIDRVVQTFTDTFGTTKTSQKDRFAANRLTSKYGSQAVCGIIRLLGERRDDRYAPVVNDVAELESKIVSVVSFLRRSKSEVETIDI